MISSGGPLQTDIPDLDLASFTLHRARELGGKPALIDGPSGRAVSYADLERSVRSLAAGLTARGFAKGDTFAIFMPNVPEYAVAFHGAVAAGGRCTRGQPPLHGARARPPAGRFAGEAAADGAAVPRCRPAGRRAGR